MVAPTKKPAAPAGKGKKKSQTFVIDCTKPVEDKIMDISSFEKFLLDKIKVNGKTGAPVLPSGHSAFAAAEEMCTSLHGTVMQMVLTRCRAMAYGLSLPNGMPSCGARNGQAMSAARQTNRAPVRTGMLRWQVSSATWWPSARTSPRSP